MRHTIPLITAAALAACSGCVTRTMTNTPRTALEQLLLSGAVDAALAKFQLPRLAGQKVFIHFADLKSVDAEYVKVATRAHFAKLGAVLVDKSDAADLTAEVASGGLGTEFKTGALGIPPIPMPGSPVAFPELPIFKQVEQTGIFKLLIFVHRGGKFVASGLFYAKCDRSESFLLFFRFVTTDDVREGWEKHDRINKALAG